MKEQSAKLRYLRVAPRKVRLVANSAKGMSVDEAEAHFLVSPKRAAGPLIKLLRSAVANAKNNQKLNPENLFIKEIRVDIGPSFKRYMPRAMGRASMIQKKSSHITLILAESDKLKKPRFKITKPEKLSKRKAEVRKKERIEREKAKPEEMKETKAAKEPGFIRRMFRRKSI